jgi:hypothetical protein
MAALPCPALKREPLIILIRPINRVPRKNGPFPIHELAS